MTICGMTAMAQDRPDITQQTGGGDHSGVSFMQMPTLVYDEEAKQIEVFGCNTDYYDVLIKLQSTGDIVWQGTIDGVHDIIDVSFLMNGTYTISLTNDKGYTYRWTFNGGLSASVVTDGVEKMSGKSVKKITGGPSSAQDILK